MNMEAMPMHQRVDTDIERIGEWRVAEKFMAPKNPNLGPEDGLYIGKNIAFVGDGISSQTKEKINGLSPGQFVIHTAIESLKKPEGGRVTSDELVRYLTEHVRLALEKARSESKNIPEHPSFVFAAFFPAESRIVRIPDCAYLVDGKGENHGLAVDIRRKELRERLKKTGSLHISELKQPLSGWQWKHRNNPGSSIYNYAVIDGTAVPEKLVEYFDVPKDAKQVVLASDGYPPKTLAMTLRETNRRYQEEILKGGHFTIDDLTYLRLEKRS